MRFILILSITLMLGGCGSPYYNVPMSPPSAYLDGEKALEQGKYEEAERHFSSYLESGRESYRARSLYQLARTRYQQENYEGATAALNRLDEEFPDFGTKQTAALRGDLLYADGQRMDAILLWEEAYAHSSDPEREALRPRIAAAMVSVSDEEAEELARSLTQPDIYNMAIDRLAGPAPDETWEVADPNALAAADLGSEDEVLADVPNGPGVATVAASETSAEETIVVADDGEEIVVASVESETVEETILEPVGPRGKIGCLLPLTGPWRQLGQAAWDSLQQSFAAGDLVIRDTGGGAAETRALTRELIADPAVIAILGPMRDDTIAAARSEAKKSGIAVVPLQSRAATGSERGDEKALATYAVKNMQLGRIGIITPQADGNPVFAETVRTLGGTIVGTHRYQADTAYLSGALAVVQQWLDGGGVDGVYIADAAVRSAEIATAARAVSPDLALLGNTAWNDADVLQASAPTIEGAVIATSAANVAVATKIRAAARALEQVQATGSGRQAAASRLANLEAGADGASTLLQIVGGTAVPIAP